MLKKVFFLFCISNFGLLYANSNLQKIDNVKMPFSEGIVSIKITSETTGNMEEMKVYLNKRNDANIEMLSDKKKGQRVLLSNSNGLWFFSPNSSRSIRITPQQRILGEASYGDIGRMRFEEDYEVTKEDNRQLPDGILYQRDDRKNYGELSSIEMVAKAPAAPYNKVVLWYDKKTFEPYIAEYLLKSGKLAKISWFSKPEQKGKYKYVTGFTIFDVLMNNKKAVIDVLSMEEKNNPSRLFSPQTFYK